MRIIRLNEESRQDILANLLKRDPNNYIGYEDKVREIVENVKNRRDEALLEYTHWQSHKAAHFYFFCYSY